MIKLNNNIFEILTVLFCYKPMNLHDIANETKLSVMGVSKIIKNLEKNNIIKVGKIGKSHLIKLNLIKDNIEVFSLAERYKFETFITKHQKLKPFLVMVKEQVKTDFTLIFGSYASSEESSKSDLDLLIVGNENNIKTINKIKALLDIELSPVFITKKDFVAELRKKHRLYLEIIDGKRVLVNGEYNFWDTKLDNYTSIGK